MVGLGDWAHSRCEKGDMNQGGRERGQGMNQGIWAPVRVLDMYLTGPVTHFLLGRSGLVSEVCINVCALMYQGGLVRDDIEAVEG